MRMRSASNEMTIPVPVISLDKAKPGKLFYVVATGTIYRDGKCLILQRASNQVAHPGVWGPVGGKLEHQDLKATPPTRMNGEVTDWEHMIESLLIREAKEESGLGVYDFRYLDNCAASPSAWHWGTRARRAMARNSESI